MSYTPVSKSERIELLDVLRGFAIFGIFIMNLQAFTYYWALPDEQKSLLLLSEYNSEIDFILRMFFEGKFYSIFSLLFGIGFALYLKKADRDPGIMNLFVRRLFVLFLIGFLHLMIWSGDIVAFYAIVGFILIPFRKLSNRSLLILAGLSILSPVLWYGLKMNYPDQLDLSRRIFPIGDKFSEKAGVNSLEDYLKAIRGGDFIQHLKLNFAGIFYRYGDLIFQSRLFKVLGFFFIGLVVGRSGIYSRVKENSRLLWTILISGLVLGLPANYMLSVYQETRGYGGLTFHGFKQTIAYALGVAPLALSYASGIALLYYGAGRKLLSLIAPAGKMALTNYLMQTLIGVMLFTGLGFSFDPIGPAAWSILAIIVFIVQIIISTLWLRAFNFGPAEWLWRSATYKKWQPMKRKKSPEV